MSHDDCNTYTNKSGIDKFDGSFDKEEFGCTIFINETVNLIKDLDACGLYTYLLCRPPNWKINIKHLTSTLNCGKNKIYRLLDYLIDLKLITRTELREKGRFSSYHYKIHIRPKSAQIVQLTPVPQKPEAVKPEAVFEDTYKTKNIKNKEYIKTTTTTENLSTAKIDHSIENQSSSSFFFSETLDKKILEQKTEIDKRTNESFLNHVSHHVDKNSDNKYPRIVRIKSAIKMLGNLNQQNIIFESCGFSETKNQDSQKETSEQKIERYRLERENELKKRNG